MLVPVMMMLRYVYLMLYVVKTFVRQMIFKIMLILVMMILVSLPYALCGHRVEIYTVRPSLFEDLP